MSLKRLINMKRWHYGIYYVVSLYDMQVSSSLTNDLSASDAAQDSTSK